jgi:hypothetical protein
VNRVVTIPMFGDTPALGGYGEQDEALLTELVDGIHYRAELVSAVAFSRLRVWRIPRRNRLSRRMRMFVRT